MPYDNDYTHKFLKFTFAQVEKLEPPLYVYIGLCTNNPEKDKGVFNELSGGGYSRVLIACREEPYPNVIGTPSNRAISNQYQINWTKATLDWARVKGFGLFSSSTGGSPFFYGKLELSKEDAAAGGLLCEAGAVMLFDPQTLRIRFPETDVAEAAAVVE